MLKKTDKNAKWELQIKWEDDSTIEMRYFETYAQAERYAESIGCEDYDIYPNK
jgi:hypothetical protein